MAERDGAAVYIELVERDFSERAIALEMLAREIGGGRARQAREGLRGEGFVDFDEIRLFDADAGLFFQLRQREDRSEPHAHRIAACISVTRERAERLQTEARGLVLAHDQQRDGAV